MLKQTGKVLKVQIPTFKQKMNTHIDPQTPFAPVMSDLRTVIPHKQLMPSFQSELKQAGMEDAAPTFISRQPSKVEGPAGIATVSLQFKTVVSNPRETVRYALERWQVPESVLRYPMQIRLKKELAEQTAPSPEPKQV